jgi:hypothetical protein
VSRKHLKTLEAVFAQPTQSNISWKDIESMLVALGVKLSEGRGSRVRIVLNGRKATRQCTYLIHKKKWTKVLLNPYAHFLKRQE